MSIHPEKQKKLDEANARLTQWANGMPINLSTTGGAEGTIRTAREDMGDFLPQLAVKLQSINLLLWKTRQKEMDIIFFLLPGIH